MSRFAALTGDLWLRAGWRAFLRVSAWDDVSWFL